jgi:hypothetical protein
VILKVGTIVTPHYAHRPDSSCALATGEGERHREMKRQAADLFPDFTVRFEVPFDQDHRADVVIGRRVIECQASSLSIAAWEERTRYYNNHGYAVLWIWDSVRARWNAPGPEQRIPAEIRRCHQMNYGAVYAMNGSGRLFSVHYSGAPRIETSDWADVSFSIRTPKTIKTVEGRVITNPRCWVRRGPDGHGLVHFGEGAWWKKDKAA